MSEKVRQLNLRVPEHIVQGLDEIASKENTDRTTVARKMLSEAIQRWKADDAIAACLRGDITKERAAELASMSVYDIMDEVRRRGAPPSYTLDELRQDLKLLRPS